MKNGKFIVVLVFEVVMVRVLNSIDQENDVFSDVVIVKGFIEVRLYCKLNIFGDFFFFSV